MFDNITISMVNNAALLLALSVVYEISFIFNHRLKKYLTVFNGVLIGLIGIAIMSFPFTLAPGLFFDTRSILICVTALVFGLIPASIAASMTIAYRLIMGGIGVLPGVSTILVSLILGILFKRFISLNRSKFRWLKLYIFGIVVHVGMLACMLTLPWDSAIQTLRDISLQVLLIYPIGVVFLALLLLRQSEYNAATKKATEADARYRSLFYNNHAVMFIIDPETADIIDANPATADFYGWPVHVLKTMNVSQISISPLAEILASMKNTIQQESIYFMSKDRRATGETIDVEIYSGPIEFNGKTLLYSIIHDISERSAALRALQESEERFRTLVDSAPDAIFVMIDGKFVFINKAGLKLFGAQSDQELIGKTGKSVIHPDFYDDLSAYMQALWAGKMLPTPIELVYIRMDETLVNIESVLAPIRFNDKDGYLVFSRDISEKKRQQQKEQDMEAQLRQQQKLEAIGTLAGGVAHEINNPLNGIMNYAQLILDASTTTPDSAEYASEIIHETERISSIVKNLLQFSRHEKQSHSYASIYDIINQTLSLVNTIIRKDQIVLDIQLDEGLPDIKCRSQQIQQVIMNLLTNARDAVNAKYPDYDEHKVVRLRCHEYMQDDRRWLRITVQDSGTGIPQELGERIFEPFFSTKPKDLGTGLGLSISYGIVKEHHGSMTFESKVGEYTTFILDLPVDNGWSLQTIPERRQ